MKCLFLTQGSSLGMFYGLGQKLSNGDEHGFVIADSWNYRSWLQQHPNFENENHEILKEWEVTSNRNRQYDLEWIQEKFTKLNAPDLFNSIISDRRLIMGERATYVQNYGRRFDDATLYSILGSGIEEMESLFDKVCPEVVVGFICVTFLDYIGYIISRARGIPYLNLRTTRIGNRITAASSLLDPSPELKKTFNEIYLDGSAHLSEAKDYIFQIREGDGRYEGVIQPSSKPAQVISKRKSLFLSATNFIYNLIKYHTGPYAKDNHTPGLVRPLIYQTILNPIRALRAESLLSHNYVKTEDLKDQRFAFFPLHTEPEVSQLVYAQPLVNQIEIIRIIAYSLPADMLLVIKEHPWMVGKRRLGAYKKLLDIPRVRFASPALSAREFIQKADLVTVLTSSVGLEATILGKPVLSFGHAPFNVLPDRIVLRAKDLLNLQNTILDFLTNYRSDEKAILAYISAVIATSFPANLYSVLLGRKNVYSIGDQSFESDIISLARHIRERLDLQNKANPETHSVISQK